MQDKLVAESIRAEGLRKEDFRLFEDDVEQKIIYLSGEDARPQLD